MVRMMIFSVAALAATPVLADAIEGAKSGGEILAETTTEDWRAIPAEETLVMQLESGTVTIALSPSLAPKHVAQVKKLAREGFYDGLSFYRVIEGFVAQGGDPFGERKIRTAKKTMKAEFETAGDNIAFAALPDADGYAPAAGFVGGIPAGHDERTGTYWHLHCAGAFAFGREDGRDTASTEFYIALQPQRYLDRNLTVFGRVIDGMEHVQALRRIEPPETKDDDIGDRIVSFRVAADIPEEERVNWEFLDSARPAFSAFVESRRNRPEGFFYYRPNYIDVCQLPAPVRKKAAS